MKLAKRSGILSFRRTAGDRIDPEGPRIWVAETKNADQEAAIARYLVDSQSEAPAWPVDLAGLTEHQLQAVALATKGSIGSLGGGPGTGKTYCAASLIHAAINHVGREKIGVAAPTGKAAVRITEVMKGYGVPIQAKTIHSLLQVEQQQDGSGWQFFYRSGRPLPLRYLIVDEASMIDTSLMCNLLAARGKGTHLLFVGDIHQLPPVGHGAPLRDMIAAGIPYGELLEIQRQAAGSLIVRACHAIRNGSANYETLHTLDEVNLG
jgi:exodeoxyribonuclease V alpha subunit